MFERYTEKARRVIFFARYEAAGYGSPFITTEHLLLGLLREDKAITNRFLQPDAYESIRQQIDAHTPGSRDKVSTSVDLPLSNECKRILAYAAEEAERLNHKHIGTEHLLLGLLREQDSFAAQMLRERGLTIEKVRAELAATAAAHEPDIRRGWTGWPGWFGGRGGVGVQRVQVTFRCGEKTVATALAVGPLPRIGEQVVVGGQPYRVTEVSYEFQPATPVPQASHLLRAILIQLEEIPAAGQPS